MISLAARTELRRRKRNARMLGAEQEGHLATVAFRVRQEHGSPHGVRSDLVGQARESRERT
jgi:hypothetical protein